MINYANHRAIFEGMNARLFNPNSGRMLWMTQPAWPSTNWQILSSDYDTQASFYGVKKACEPVHVQMNLPGLEAAVVNNTATAITGLTLRARSFGLDGNVIFTKEQTVDAAPMSVMTAFTVAQATDGVSIVKLELLDAQHQVISENFYWHAPDAGVTLRLENTSTSPVLMAKATVIDSATGQRILPAYFSDNYVSLLPGESKVVRIEIPASAQTGEIALNLRGWNVHPVTVRAQR
jgi:hypothetical protein